LSTASNPTARTSILSDPGSRIGVATETLRSPDMAYVSDVSGAPQQADAKSKKQAAVRQGRDFHIT
jgi:hypothetical protein